jgi:predicted nucleotidyltransferase
MPTQPPVAPSLARLSDLLSDVPGVRAAVLFGSYATGHAQADSDIDLLVVRDSEDGDEFEVSHQPFDGTTLELTFVSSAALERDLREGLPFALAVLRHGVDLWGHAYLEQLRSIAPPEPAPRHVRAQAAAARRRLRQGDLRGAATYALNAKRLASNNLGVSCHLERLSPPSPLTEGLVGGWIEEVESRYGRERTA